ncbi:MAG: class I SAM-dependent methyltransferase [Solirubrobacteraceae bacterium]
MIAAHLDEILRRLPDDAALLDVGGWAAPLERADWVIDLLPHETRGLYGTSDPERERFSAATWVQRDICDREPWPFTDDQFDYVICAQTLEDVRDPVFVCSEMARIAKAGYLETPSWRAELRHRVNGPWTGYSHHRWLVRCDQDAAHAEFVFKFGTVHSEPYRMPHHELTEAEANAWLWWEGSFTAAERIIMEPAELDAELRAFVAANAPASRTPARRGARARAALRRRSP